MTYSPITAEKRREADELLGIIDATSGSNIIIGYKNVPDYDQQSKIFTRVTFPKHTEPERRHARRNLKRLLKNSPDEAFRKHYRKRLRQSSPIEPLAWVVATNTAQIGFGLVAWAGLGTLAYIYIKGLLEMQ